MQLVSRSVVLLQVCRRRIFTPCRALTGYLTHIGGQARSLLGGNRSGMEDMSLLEVSLRWLNLSGLFLFLEPLNYLAHFRYAGVKRTKAEVMMVQDVG